VYSGAFNASANAQGVNPASYSSSAIGSPVIANLPPVPPTPIPVDLGVAIGVPIGVVAAVAILAVAAYYSLKESDKATKARKALSNMQMTGSGAAATNLVSTHLSDSEQFSSSFRGENPMMQHQQSASKMKFGVVAANNPVAESDGSFSSTNPMRSE
jgi:hypothetical protein